VKRAAAAGIAVVAALTAAVAVTTRDADAQACARPNVPAMVVRVVEPESIPLAQQQGIGGVVIVIVSLDAQSHVTAARIQSSPSAILNNAALVAARQTTSNGDSQLRSGRDRLRL
jgi:TonB family protein